MEPTTEFAQTAREKLIEKWKTQAVGADTLKNGAPLPRHCFPHTSLILDVMLVSNTDEVQNFFTKHGYKLELKGFDQRSALARHAGGPSSSVKDVEAAEPSQCSVTGA